METQERPEREPDFVLGLWEFFFAEMVQWNPSECRNYTIRASTKKEIIMWYSRDNNWCSYGDISDDDSDSLIYDAYLNWQVESILMR